jgi:hypothetical protein
MRPHSAGDRAKGDIMTHGSATGTWVTWRVLTPNEQALIMWGMSELEAVTLAKVLSHDLSSASESEIADAVIVALCAAKIAVSGDARVQIVFAERRDNRRVQ